MGTRLGMMAGLAEEQIHRVPSSDAMPDPRWGDRNMAITVDDGDETCLTVVFINEDHTLGNMLRYILSKQPQVEFVGYAVLQQAFADMEAMANILEAKFEDAYAQVN